LRYPKILYGYRHSGKPLYIPVNRLSNYLLVKLIKERRIVRHDRMFDEKIPKPVLKRMWDVAGQRGLMIAN
jgi:hypothetical protein